MKTQSDIERMSDSELEEYRKSVKKAFKEDILMPFKESLIGILDNECPAMFAVDDISENYITLAVTDETGKRTSSTIDLEAVYDTKNEINELIDIKIRTKFWNTDIRFSSVNNELERYITGVYYFLTDDRLKSKVFMEWKSYNDAYWRFDRLRDWISNERFKRNNQI